MSSILTLDLGEKRIGVARASSVARLAEPLTTLTNNDQLADELQKLIKEHDVNTLVIGLPRGLQGQTTAQTIAIQDMAEKLQQELKLKIHWQDETLTSRQAETELRARGLRYNQPMHRKDYGLEIRAGEQKSTKSRHKARRLSQRLDSRKQNANYKESVDALAACFILEDFLSSHPQK